MATATASRIEPDIDPILRGMTFDGNAAILNCGQLDRKVYERVNRVLEALGGKWNRKAKGHVFDECPEEVIADAVAAGEYVDAKKAFQFYETPDALADELCEWAAPLSDYILEPSAGKGSLIRAAKRATNGDCCVSAVEINEKHRTELNSIAYELLIQDFLTVDPSAFVAPFGRVVMNPPFTRSQDIDHVRHAFGFLSSGGVLVAIMSPGFTFRSDRKAVEFRGWFEGLDGEIRHNDPGAFKSSGTMVNTVMVRIKNPE